MARGIKFGRKLKLTRHQRSLDNIKAGGRKHMKCWTAIMPILLACASLSEAQESRQERVQSAIFAAERICLSGNRFRFELEADGSLTIQKLVPGAQVTVDSAEARGSQFFNDEKVGKLVDADTRQCMQAEWRRVIDALQGPEPRSSDNQAKMNAVVALIYEGQMISDVFMYTNNVDQLKQNYELWFAKADRILSEEFNAGYEVQFRNALPVNYARNGMAKTGLGHWQHLTGQLAVLNGLITELRR
jgi:hypothetical protein